MKLVRKFAVCNRTRLFQIANSHGIIYSSCINGDAKSNGTFPPSYWRNILSFERSLAEFPSRYAKFRENIHWDRPIKLITSPTMLWTRIYNRGAHYSNSILLKSTALKKRFSEWHADSALSKQISKAESMSAEKSKTFKQLQIFFHRNVYSWFQMSTATHLVGWYLTIFT